MEIRRLVDDFLEVFRFYAEENGGIIILVMEV